MLAFYGKFNALIVGRRYYNSDASVNETVKLVREKYNPYDTNAIGVYTHQEDKLGHLPRWLAAVLAPCIDHGQCKLSGIVTATGNEYVAPVEIELYAPASAATQIRAMLGTYWKLWRFELPSIDVDSNDRDEAMYIVDELCQSSKFSNDGYVKVLIISTLSGIGSWADYVSRLSLDIGWVVCNRSTTLDVISGKNLVFVSFSDAFYVLAKTSADYWTTIAVDKTAIEKEQSEQPSSFFLNASQQLDTVCLI